MSLMSEARKELGHSMVNKLLGQISKTSTNIRWIEVNLAVICKYLEQIIVN